MKPGLLISIVCATLGCSADDSGQRRTTTPPASGNAGQATDPAPEAPPPSSNLKASDAEAYFQSGAAKEGADFYALELYEKAAEAFARHISLKKPQGSDLGRARLLLGLSQAASGEWKAARKNFVDAAADLPLLSDYLSYQAARASFRVGDRKSAKEWAAKVDKKSIVGPEAQLILGDLMRISGVPASQVAAHYRGYLDTYSKGPRISEARYYLAQALSKEKAYEEALSLWRRITVAAPLSRWSERAQARIKETLPRTRGALRKKFSAAFTADELVTRGKAYFRSMRNKESESDFEQALKDRKITTDAACVAAYHRAQSVFKQRQRKRAAPLFDSASAACAKTDNKDLQVKSAYQAGRSYANAAMRDQALVRYRKAETLHPEHSYSDDARLRQAEEYRDQGKQGKVTERLAGIPDAYPQGDMRAEAMWRLAWRAFKGKRYREAIKWLDKQVATKSFDENYWAEGQAHYWLGRAWAELGKNEKSVAEYRNAVLRYPLSYYSLLALNRLREKHPREFASIKQEIAPTPQNQAPAPSFAGKDVYKEEGFRRALEFLRLGLGDPAAAELRKLGLSSPPGKKAIEDKEKAEKIWAMAFLYNRAKKFGPSHWVMRWHVLDYKRHWPRDKWRVWWDVAFPQAWWNLLETWAKKRGYPVELQIAFVREESGFNPILESYANAIGLTQMIYPTAKRFSKGTGINVNKGNFRPTLRDPVKNVTIGSNFLAFLMRRFEGRIALVVPSYNAGEGATYKWLRRRGTWPQDEWSEEIPYDQARRYSKRVIATYFTYSYLKDGTIPAMPNDIPPSVIPKKR